MAAGEKTGGLLEWVAYTALIAVTGLAGVFLPLFYFPAVVFMPLPAILLVLRLDARYGVLGLATAGFVMLFAGQEPAAALVMIIRYGLLGIVYGMLFKNYVSSGKSLAAALSAAVALTVASVALMYALTGENPLALGQEERRLLEQQWMAMNQQMQAFENMHPERQADFNEYLISIYELYIPGQIVVSSAISAALTYILARIVLERLQFKIPPAPLFSTMYLPWYSIWGLIAGLGFILLGDQFSPLLAKAGKNILFVLLSLYLFMGLSVAVFYYRKIKLALPLKIIFLFLSFSYLPFSITVLLLLGATDPLINFRRLPDLK
ncbi:YybS family protein [Pelotomaculum terephthalicicum JT]|uniref:YybS family protein n=1 Tax=Pelotomaculum TaxID=191373 RepID=UPI0009CCF6C9|nr:MULTISPECIES: DUF2232 domain-containing protein [Pelotomaculum]MCG9969011.1 YybS family protein [Pelotomaculum terephthalicicum JT]OPX91385.1 MAG: hypothetical protein A4E54_00333 [Pelotomaculum sp. PtaB.Bin117]OPY59380.1 MAG: hypothetical protein A4E56_03221 [Pelotomaculum sp. PtaU1.Bin065]